MDFILKKLDSMVAISEENTVEMQTLLRERIEYVFFVILGCLWNENIKELELEKKSRIIENLYKMSIGEVVKAIRELDVDYRYITKKELKIIDKYPRIRNEKMGHGYTHNDDEPKLEMELKGLYEDITRLNFVKNEYDIVYIGESKDGKYKGIRYAIENNGLPTKWSCPAEVLDENIKEGSVFLLDRNSVYYRITPFIAMKNRGEEIYVFQSLMDKLSGCVKMNQLFKSGSIEMRFDEFISISVNESERRRISSNGTIMNYFDTNYRKYINVAIESRINEFLKQNRANVQATIWGHGGVGKTACIQNICLQKFNGLQREFSYIIFLSAKDRMLDPKTGKILEIKNLRSYEEIVDSVIAVVFDEDSEKESLESKEKNF